MATSQKDLKKFYGCIRMNIYPKNGSWKDAPIMKNAVYAWLSVTIVMLEIIGLAGFYDYWY